MERSLIVTKELAIRAVLFGACRIPMVGKSIKDFSQPDLIWAERILSIKERKKIGLPLWVLGSGYGDGYGYGSG